MKKRIFCSIFLMFTLIIYGANKLDTRIIPQPQIVEELSSEFTFDGDLTISIICEDSQKEAATYSIAKISESLKNKFDIACDEAEKGAISLKINPTFSVGKELDEKLLDQSYSLKINKAGIEIEAKTSQGLFYGAMSLVQLIDNAASKKLGGMEIIDWPDLNFRGISDDISRGQVANPENFKRIIEHMARYKMNTFMPYLEDMLLFEKYPTIGVKRGALTKDEIKEIIEFADKHFVEVIPVFQTLGHYENILTQPEFVEYAEYPGAASLAIADEKIYPFIEDMLKVVFELFPSEYINMGADESYDVGYGKSKKLVEESSLADVHVKHYKRVYDFCVKNGKKVWMYGDIILHHPSILEKLPKDITVVDWHYGVDFDYSSAKTFKDAGQKYLVSPSVWNFTSTFPVNMLAIPNIKNLTEAGIRNGAEGMINSNWGDFGGETIKELILYGYAWSAQCAWSYEKSDIAKFDDDYFNDFFGCDDDIIPGIYSAFNETYNQPYWSNFWRNPALPFRDAKWWEYKLSPAVQIAWLDNSIPTLTKKIAKAKSIATKNQDHFEILDMLLGLNEFYKEKLSTTYLLRKSIDEKKTDIEQLNKMIDKNLELISKSKKEYREIWLKYNKEENLWMIEDKFDRMISYFNEIKEALANNTLVSPELQSDWIYCPKGKDSFEKRALFMKRINIDSEIKSAKLQLMGDSYCKLYINGEFVEEVYARRSLSLIGDYRRVKFVDVTKYLKKGENEIKVISENFYKKSFAGCNIIAEIKSGKETLELKTDESWWTKANSDKAEKWLPVRTKEYPHVIINPNFETDRPSWVER